MLWNPLETLKAAIRAVPPVKYALGVAGVISVIAIVRSFGIDFKNAAVGAVVVFALMTLLVVFASISKTPQDDMRLPAMVFTWFVLVMVMAVSVAMFYLVFWKHSIDLSAIFGHSDKPVDQSPAPQKPVESPKSDVAEKPDLPKLCDRTATPFICQYPPIPGGYMVLDKDGMAVSAPPPAGPENFSIVANLPRPGKYYVSINWAGQDSIPVWVYTKLPTKQCETDMSGADIGLTSTRTDGWGKDNLVEQDIGSIDNLRKGRNILYFITKPCTGGRIPSTAWVQLREMP